MAQYIYLKDNPAAIVEAPREQDLPVRIHSPGASDDLVLTRTRFLDRLDGDMIVVGTVRDIQEHCFSVVEKGNRTHDTELDLHLIVERVVLGMCKMHALDLKLLRANIPGCVEFAGVDGPERVSVGDTFLIACRYDEAGDIWYSYASIIFPYAAGMIGRFHDAGRFDGFDPDVVLEQLADAASLDSQMDQADVIAVLTIRAGATMNPRDPLEGTLERLVRGDAKPGLIAFSLTDACGVPPGFTPLPGSRVLAFLRYRGGRLETVSGRYSLRRLDPAKSVPCRPGTRIDVLTYVEEREAGR